MLNGGHLQNSVELVELRRPARAAEQDLHVSRRSFCCWTEVKN